jgi:hypothetical protein
MSLTKLSLGGNYDFKYKLFLPRESWVSDISAGDGNIEKHFLRRTLGQLRHSNLLRMYGAAHNMKARHPEKELVCTSPLQ